MMRKPNHRKSALDALCPARGALVAVFVATCAVCCVAQPGERLPPPREQDGARLDEPLDDLDHPPPKDDGPGGHGPKRRGGPFPGKPLWDRMSEEERAAVDAFINEHFPVVAEELDQLKRRQVDRYERRVRQLAPEMRELMDLMELNPVRGRLTIAERRADMLLRLLALRHRLAADESKRKEVREQMQTASVALFDARQARQAHEITDLEARLDELKRRHADAAQRREEIVDDQVQKRLEKPPFEPGRPRFPFDRDE